MGVAGIPESVDGGSDEKTEEKSHIGNCSIMLFTRRSPTPVIGLLRVSKRGSIDLLSSSDTDESR